MRADPNTQHHGLGLTRVAVSPRPEQIYSRKEKKERERERHYDEDTGHPLNNVHILPIYLINLADWCDRESKEGRIKDRKMEKKER